MSFVTDLASFYLGSELARDAESTLPSYYDVESSFVTACDHSDMSNGSGVGGGFLSFLVEQNSLFNEIVNWDADSVNIRFYFRPVADLVEVISRDDDGNFVSSIAAKVFDSDGCFFHIPTTFPINKVGLGILPELSLEQRVGFLTELVRVFSNLVRFHSGVEGLRSDLVGCLGQLVGFLRLAVRDYCDSEAGSSDDGAGNAGDDSPFHAVSLSGGECE